MVPTQNPTAGHEPGKIVGAPPGKGVTFHTPLAGLFEVTTFPLSLITQNEVEGHDTPLTALESTCVLCQADEPPDGSVELITLPTLSPATQSVADLQKMAVIDTEQ